MRKLTINGDSRDAHRARRALQILEAHPEGLRRSELEAQLGADADILFDIEKLPGVERLEPEDVTWLYWNWRFKACFCPACQAARAGDL